jgi:hypothetical protein
VIAEVVRVGLAAVFLLAAVSKLADRRASRAAVVAFGVPEHAAGALRARACSAQRWSGCATARR